MANQRKTVSEPQESPKKKRLSFKNVVQAVEVENYLDIWWVIGNLKFILFLAFLAIVHISSNHNGVARVKKKEKLRKELMELRWEYMTIKSELMHASKQSEVAKKVEHLGIKELQEPPYKIIATD